jgi:hypothetical protein
MGCIAGGQPRMLRLVRLNFLSVIAGGQPRMLRLVRLNFLSV